MGKAAAALPGMLPGIIGGAIGGGGGGGGQQDVTTTTAPWAAQQPYLQDLFSGAQDWLQGGGPQFFPGQTYAGFDPSQMAGQQGALDYAGGGLQDIAGQTQTGLGQMLSATPNMDVWGPVMDAAMTRPIQAFTEQVLPAIRGGAQGAGQYGGSRQGIAEGLGMGRLGQSLSDTQARLSQYAASEALGQRQAGMQMAPSIAGLGMMPSQMQQQVGGQRQAMEQMGIGEDVARFGFEQNQPLANLQAYQGLIGGGYGGEQTQPYFNNPLMGGLGGAMMGNQMAQGKGGGKGGGYDGGMGPGMASGKGGGKG